MTEIILTTDPEEIERIRAMTFDPAVGRWLMQVGLPTKLTKPYVTRDTPSQKGGDIITEIPLGLFVPMAGLISQYKRKPWTGADTKELRRLWTIRNGQRRILKEAASILSRDAEPWRKIPGMAEHMRRWDEAIQVLEAPRGTETNPHEWLYFSEGGQGDDMEPWVYMATQIAAWLAQILRSYEQPPPSFGEKSPIVVFTHEALQFIGVNRTLSRKTIGNELRKRLAPLLKDWPKAAR